VRGVKNGGKLLQELEVTHRLSLKVTQGGSVEILESTKKPKNGRSIKKGDGV